MIQKKKRKGEDSNKTFEGERKKRGKKGDVMVIEVQRKIERDILGKIV